MMLQLINEAFLANIRIIKVFLCRSELVRTYIYIFQGLDACEQVI